MLPNEKYDFLVPKIRKHKPDLSDDQAFELAEKYSELAKLCVQVWLKNINKNSKDPP